MLRGCSLSSAEGIYQNPAPDYTRLYYLLPGYSGIARRLPAGYTSIYNIPPTESSSFDVFQAMDSYVTSPCIVIVLSVTGIFLPDFSRAFVTT